MFDIFKNRLRSGTPLKVLDGGRPRAKRVSVELKGSFMHEKRMQRETHQVQNLSLTGARLTLEGSAEKPLPMQIVTLSFSFPGQKKPFQIMSQVIWQKDNTMGVQFLRFMEGGVVKLVSLMNYWEELHSPYRPKKTKHLKLVQS